MNLSFVPYKADQRPSLIDFIAADTYPFNGTPRPTQEQVASWIDKGLYTETFWIIYDGTPVGVVQYQDASEVHAEIHIRLRTPFRGRGIGTPAIRWLTAYLFGTFPTKHRVEGWTRVDNIAMRRVFRACGYVKEAHLRLDFPVGDGSYMDKVGYGLLRADWETDSTTTVRWADEDEISRLTRHNGV